MTGFIRKMPTWLMAVMALAMLAVPGRAQDTAVMAAPLPPYCINKGLHVSGIGVDTMTEIMAAAKVPFDPKQVKLMPFAVGLKKVLNLQGQALLNVPQDNIDGTELKLVGPVDVERYALIGRKGRGLKISTWKDAARYQIATIRGSDAEQALIAWGADPMALMRSSAHILPLYQLASKEADLIALPDMAMAYYLETMGTRGQAYEIVHVYKHVPLFFAFSRDTDDGLVKRLNDALKTLQRPGPNGKSRFDAIVEKYLPDGRLQ
jgi:polar amino acid transport system substrate-binding protein